MIHIYGLSRETLRRRVKMNKEKFLSQLTSIDITQSHINYLYSLKTFPQRTFDYNHVIGVVCVKVERNAINIELFMPYKIIDRYKWNSKSKILLHNKKLNGYHLFAIGKSSKEISEWLDYCITDISKKYISNRFYLDREAFDSINPVVDYEKIIRNCVETF